MLQVCTFTENHVALIYSAPQDIVCVRKHQFPFTDFLLCQW